MARETILVIEDEEDILELVRYNLDREGFTVSGVVSGEEGLQEARRVPPNLILLDLMLPGLDGLQVCHELKADPRTAKTPIIFFSAKGEEADIVSGLELGADDYITKPFSPRILIARVKAVLRRRRFGVVDENTPLHVDELLIDPQRHEVRLGTEIIPLTATEFKLLHFLARRPGWVFTRYQIVDAVRGADCAVTDRAVDVQIVGLRRKLGEFGKYIETVRGVGYRFRERRE